MSAIHHTHTEPEERIAPAPRTKRIVECDEKLRAELAAFIEAGGKQWSNSTIATQVGYTPAVISRYRGDQDGCLYEGDIAAVERRLREFLRDQRLQLDTSVETIDWEGAQKISRAIEDIRTAKRIGVIIAPPGFGKSRGIDLYCREHELAIPLHCWSGECNKSSVSSCLFAAADVGRPARGENEAQTLARLLKGSTRPVLLDDAHKLTCQALQLLYDLRDQTGLPIVLFGDERLIGKLKNDPQRLRRTGIVYRLKIENPVPLIDHHINSIIPHPGGQLPAIRKLCEKIAGQAGHFGSVQMELALAVRIKQGAPDWDWCKCIQAAHTKLIRDYTLN